MENYTDEYIMKCAQKLATWDAFVIIAVGCVLFCIVTAFTLDFWISVFFAVAVILVAFIYHAFLFDWEKSPSKDYVVAILNSMHTMDLNGNLTIYTGRDGLNPTPILAKYEPHEWSVDTGMYCIKITQGDECIPHLIDPVIQTWLGGKMHTHHNHLLKIHSKKAEKSKLKPGADTTSFPSLYTRASKNG